MDGNLYYQFALLIFKRETMKKRIVISFVLLIILTACSAKSNSIFADNTCIAPCWYDIYPGSTTDEQSLVLLNNNERIAVPVEKIEYSEDDGKINKLRFYFKNNLTFVGEINYQRGVVNYINLYSENWSIENIISFFGEPDYYFSNFQRYESTYRTVFLFYPDLGTIIVALPNDFNSQNDNSIISNNTKVVNIVSFSTNDFSTSSISFYFGDFGGKLTNILKENVHPWAGVGELQTVKFP